MNGYIKDLRSESSRSIVDEGRNPKFDDAMSLNPKAKVVKAFAPATAANFIVGFDSLGAAVEEIIEIDGHNMTTGSGDGPKLDEAIDFNSNTMTKLSTQSKPHEMFGDEVIIEDRPKEVRDIEYFWDIIITGKYADRLPSDTQKNIVTMCCHAFHRDIIKKTTGQKLKTFTLTLKKGLPVCSGLGSSAASIVASLVALRII